MPEQCMRGDLCELAEEHGGKPNKTVPAEREDGMIISEDGPIGYNEILIGRQAVQVCFSIVLEGGPNVPTGSMRYGFAHERR